MKKQLGYTLTELLIVVGFGVSLAAICGIFYVAIHFMSKF